MNSDRIWVLLGKQASGEISAAELAELDALLEQDPDAAASRKFISKIWNSPLEVKDDDKAQVRIWDNVRRRMMPKRRMLVVRNMAAAAALLLLLGGGAWIIIRQSTHTRTHARAHNSTHHICSPAAGKSKIELPDGTQVWLNHNSELVYNNKDFGRINREVTLTGEAFFDVTANGKLPFIIHAATVNITVLGTAFNVKAYTTDKTVSTTLIRGKIAISFREQPGKIIELRPDEKLTVPVAAMPQEIIQHKILKDSNGNVPEISWLNGKLAFDDETFGELSKKMENWYGVTFHFEDPALTQLRFSGVIDTEPVNEALGALQLSRHFTFRVTGKDVWISR